MGKKYKLGVFAALLAGIAGIVYFFRKSNIAVLNPKGSIAQDQFELIIFVSALSLLIVVPVFALTFYIVWKYRVTTDGTTHKHKKAKYNPDWDGNRLLESIWWAIPLALITILSLIIWNTSHRLDPFRPLRNEEKPLKVQVIAMEWKWLFIYPEQNIATVNLLQFPEDTPISFQITSDAPMNSFWIPQLGGQVYAMSGMSTKLHLIADKQGVYKGQSANISGRGFSGMRFDAKATSKADFNAWVDSVKKVPQKLTLGEYARLSKQTQNHPVTLYASSEHNVYDTVIDRYVNPELKSRETDRRDMADDSYGGGEH